MQKLTPVQGWIASFDHLVGAGEQVITTADGATGGHKVRVVVPGAWGPTQPAV